MKDLPVAFTNLLPDKHKEVFMVVVQYNLKMMCSDKKCQTSYRHPAWIIEAGIVLQDQRADNDVAGHLIFRDTV